MNEELTYQVIQEAINHGVREFVVCPGSRNSSFVEVLRLEKHLKVYYHPEERSAAFFASGRSKLLQGPVAIITTSGTAVAELFPATMDAYYSGVPLLLITADRPARFRGCGAPQSAEQVKLFGQYTHYFQDVDKNTECDLSFWEQEGPAHLNICLEEPQSEPAFKGQLLNFNAKEHKKQKIDLNASQRVISEFLQTIKQPIAVVCALKPQAQEAVAQFLLKLQIPVFLEGISGLREDPRLQHLRIQRTDKILETASELNYEVDGILRIGGIPTHRIWRDLEYHEDKIKVCSITEQPFSGLSWNCCVAQGPIGSLLTEFFISKRFTSSSAQRWLEVERNFKQQKAELCEEEPMAEPSLVRTLSSMIPSGAFIYLGNSLPIREWDVAAEGENKEWVVAASRGTNGIDGQISNFLGQCQANRENWAIIGDLTALYDMAGLWILSSLEIKNINIVIINNGGGKIFERMYPYEEMLNLHDLNFEPLARMWGLTYEKWEGAPSQNKSSSYRLIEIIPDAKATHRFGTKLGQLGRLHTPAPAVTMV